MRLCVRALVAQMCDVPGVEMHLTPTAVLGLTGEPSPDFNRLTLADGPDGEEFLTRSVARARARGLPLVAVMSPKAIGGATQLLKRHTEPEGQSGSVEQSAQTPRARSHTWPGHCREVVQATRSTQRPWVQTWAPAVHSESEAHCTQ